MKYLTIILQNESACLCHAYDKKPDALAEYHTEMCYRHKTRTSTLGLVIDSNGTIIAHEKYVRVAEPVPEVAENAES